MTENQIEVAARKLCELRGIDPESLIAHEAKPDSRGFVPAILLHSKAWKVAAAEVRSAVQMHEAIAAGLAAQEE